MRDYEKFPLLLWRILCFLTKECSDLGSQIDVRVRCLLTAAVWPLSARCVSSTHISRAQMGWRLRRPIGQCTLRDVARENVPTALRTAQNPAAALCFSCCRRMAVIRETVLPRLQSSISQPGKWYVHHLCYRWYGTSLHITCVRPDKDMIGEMESHQTPAIPGGWEGEQHSQRGPAVAFPWFSGTHHLMYIPAKQTIHLTSRLNFPSEWQVTRLQWQRVEVIKTFYRQM